MLIEKNYIDSVSYRRKRKMKQILIILAILIIVAIVFITLFIKIKPELEINNLILKSNQETIKLTNIKQLNLWKKTLSKIKNENNKIEIQYDTYKIILNTAQLEKQNNIETSLQKTNKYSDWNNIELIEIDVSKVEKINCIDQIELDNDKLLQGLRLVDIYGINKNTKKSEFMATKNLEEGNVIILPHEEYEKYILVYVPISEISLEEDKINIYQNESHKLKFKVLPENATNKRIDIEFDEKIVNITEDADIVGKQEGETEIILRAEENTVTKKIKAIIKIKTEGIEVTSENIELAEGENRNIHAKILPETINEKTLNYKSINEEIAKVDENGKITGIKEGKTTIVITSKAEPVQKREIFVTIKKKIEEAETNLASTNNNIQNNYINGILLVNKKYSLPNNYNPGTNQEALQAFNTMKSVAAQNGISLWIVSGFRSYQTQTSIYNRNVGLYGENTANTFSAKPGQSEHQTGLAFDINSTKWAFAETKEAKWLAENCYEYGFIIRYPEGKEDITGYVYEPWHIRYVGKETALKIKQSGLCLEEYLGVN